MIGDILWGLVGAIAAIVWETLSRRVQFNSWIAPFLLGFPLQAIVAASIYHLLNRSPHFLGGALWFTASVWTLRVLMSQFYFGETVPLRTWFACAIVVGATIYDKVAG